jgi:hypothetical protein
MFRSMGMKVFPRVAWPSLMAGNVTDWRQSISGCSGVAYPDLRLVGGIITPMNVPGGAHDFFESIPTPRSHPDLLL